MALDSCRRAHKPSNDRLDQIVNPLATLAGFVYQISNVLSGMGVNIESMETKTYAAPISSTPIFQLEADLAVPTRTNIAELRERFSEIQRQENIDIDLAATKN